MYIIRTLAIGAVLLLITVVVACDARKSASGFRLPEGDVERGQAVFVELKCHTCHRVYRVVNMQAPTADPTVPVVLGGRVFDVVTDGQLVTSIIHPSYSLARGHPKEVLQNGGLSRMGDFNDVLTVRQLADLVAFLHSSYEFEPHPSVK